jgi:hypothetical protein
MSSRLDAVLKRHSAPSTVLGGKGIDREALREELSKLRVQVGRMMWIATIMVIVVFIIDVVLAVKYVIEPTLLTGAGTAVGGLTVGGTIAWMRRLARETAQTSLLIILSVELSAETMATTVRSLVGKL